MLKKLFQGKLKTILLIAIFILLFLLGYLYVSKVLERKDAYIKNAAFFEEKNNYDVVFLGTSHMRDGVYPMELWNQYGIFSYNLAGPGNSMGVSYWELVNAMDYTTPELVVLDCAQISNSVMLAENSNFTHTTFDLFPLSPNKLRAILDLADEGNRMAYLWPFSVYHSRWNELTQNDFVPQSSLEKGARSRVGVAIPDKMAVVAKEKKSSMDSLGVEYLCKIIELCQEREIEVLLTYLPFPASAEKIMEANLAYDIADQYGVNYINFLAMDDMVDFDTDCYDSNSHLNPSGSRKVTEYIGTYIKEHYNIKDRREDSDYQSWFDDYDEYTEYKIGLVKSQTSLDTELAMLYDKNLSTCIYIKENSEILQDERMVKLIKNVSPYVDLTQIETAVQNKSEYFVVIDNGWCDIWESVGGETLQDLGTTFGTVSYASDNGMPALFIQGSEESFLVGANEEGEMPDVQIVTINKLTGEIVHQSSFVMNGYDDYGNVMASKVN